jgi:hypothetical protein
MRRSMIATVFAALAITGLCTGANAGPAGPSLLIAKATETSVTQVYWRHRHWRSSYRPSVYGYRYAGYYRPRVYGYSPRVYGYRGYRGCGW